MIDKICLKEEVASSWLADYDVLEVGMAIMFGAARRMLFGIYLSYSKCPYSVEAHCR